MSTRQVGQTRFTQLLLTVTSTTHRDNLQVTPVTEARRGGHIGRTAAQFAIYRPSFSAARRAPSTRLVIFWNATSRA